LEAAQVRWLPAGVDQTGDSYVSAALDNAAAVLDLGFALLKERVAQLQASATAVRESFEQTDQQLVKEVVEDAFCTRRTPTPPPAPGPTGAPWSPEPLIIVPADG
jgi:outer membrane protein TolC